MEPTAKLLLDLLINLSKICRRMSDKGKYLNKIDLRNSKLKLLTVVSCRLQLMVLFLAFAGVNP